MNASLRDQHLAIEKLRADHDVDAFDCGKEELNHFLKRYALVNQKAGSTQTYVACRGQRVWLFRSEPDRPLPSFPAT